MSGKQKWRTRESGTEKEKKKTLPFILAWSLLRASEPQSCRDPLRCRAERASVEYLRNKRGGTNPLVPMPWRSRVVHGVLTPLYFECPYISTDKLISLSAHPFLGTQAWIPTSFPGNRKLKICVVTEGRSHLREAGCHRKGRAEIWAKRVWRIPAHKHFNSRTSLYFYLQEPVRFLSCLFLSL